MTIGGVLAAMIGAGQDTLAGTADATVCGWACWTAGDGCADTGWLRGGDIDVVACGTTEPGAEAEAVGAGVGVLSSSPTCDDSRRRF